MRSHICEVDALIDVDYYEGGGKKFIKLAAFINVCIGLNRQTGQMDVATMQRTVDVYRMWGLFMK